MVSPSSDRSYFVMFLIINATLISSSSFKQKQNSWTPQTERECEHWAVPMDEGSEETGEEWQILTEDPLADEGVVGGEVTLQSTDITDI